MLPCLKSFVSNLKKVTCVSKCSACNRTEEKEIRVGKGKIIMVEHLEQLIAEFEKLKAQ